MRKENDNDKTLWNEADDDETEHWIGQQRPDPKKCPAAETLKTGEVDTSECRSTRGKSGDQI